MSQRTRTGLRLLLINLFLVTILLVAAEFLLEARAVPDAVRYSVYPPNQIVTVRVDPNVTPGVHGDAVFEINSLGTRGPLLSPDDRIRILAIGGSTTECFVLSLEESWPFLLGRELQSRTGERTWVGNIAHAGRNSRQHYFDARYVVPQFGRVDFAVLLVGINDLFNRMIQGKGFDPVDVVDLDAKGSYIESALQISEASESWFEGLQLARRGRRLLESFALLRSPAREVGRSVSQTLPDYYVQSREERADRGETIDELPPMTVPLAEFERDMTLIVKQLRGYGTIPVLVTQPSLWKPDLSKEEDRLLWLGSADGWPPNHEHAPFYSVRAMAAMLKMYNDALRSLAAGEGIDLVDLEKLVPADLTTFYDDIHFNESGSRRVAEALAGYITSRDLIGRRRAGGLP